MTDKLNMREIAVDVLIEILEHGQYSHLVLGNTLGKYQYLEKSDGSFLTRLVEGTLEHLIEMDYILEIFSSIPVRKMKPLIRTILRISVYQMKYMDKVPDSAICNEAVKLAKKRGLAKLSGFVNGILRNIARNLEKVHYPDMAADPVQYLNVRYSMPEWILEQWIDTYGTEKTKEILESFSKEYPLTVRVNRTRTTVEQLVERLNEENVTVLRYPDIPYALGISGFDYLEALDSFNDGDFYVQDISSMMVAEFADVKQGDYIVDVCAAPGGKSTHLAELLNKTGCVDARDLTEYKVSLIEQNIERTELDNLKVKVWDATVFDESIEEKADVVICDLPCSGLGVLGKKKDIRYRMTPENQKELVVLQKKILSVVHSYVKSGGILMYSTCTIHKEENEEMVQWFLNRHPEFKMEFQRQIFPGEVGVDGFYLAKLHRVDK